MYSEGYEARFNGEAYEESKPDAWRRGWMEADSVLPYRALYEHEKL
jgi:hypothetical protein